MTHRLSTPSQRRQCGDAMLRMLVTPGSLLRPLSAKTGEGMPRGRDRRQSRSKTSTYLSIADRAGAREFAGRERNGADEREGHEPDVVSRLFSQRSRRRAGRGRVLRVRFREGELTIRPMSRLCGISLRTLRFYGGRGLVQPRGNKTNQCLENKRMGVNQSANGNSQLLLAKQTADKYITGNGGEPSKARGGYSHKRPGEATAAENAEKVRRALIVLRTLTPFMPIASLRSDAENALADIREFFR